MAESEAAREAADGVASRARGEFLATYEPRAAPRPSTPSAANTELLALGVAGPVTEQQRDYLARLRASSRHLLGVVNEGAGLSPRAGRRDDGGARSPA
jgi:hypothetical protein